MASLSTPVYTASTAAVNFSTLTVGGKAVEDWKVNTTVDPAVNQRKNTTSRISDWSLYKHPSEGSAVEDGGATQNTTISWTSDGTPTASGSESNGARVQGEDSDRYRGQEWTVQADIGERTVRFYIGRYSDTNAANKFVIDAHLSDSSAPDTQLLMTGSNGSDADGYVDITFSAASDNQTLRLRYYGQSGVSNYFTASNLKGTWLSVKSSTGTTINAALGTAVASGFNANVAQSVIIDAAIGTAVASGNQAQIGQGLNIDTAIGTAVASGFQATIAAGETINANLGTAEASGFNALVSAENIIAASIGEAVASGFTATIGSTTGIDTSLGTAVASGFTAEVESLEPSYGFASDIQSTTPGALLDFFEIDLSPIGIAEQYYFHNGINNLGDDVTWQGQIYTRFPIDAEGFEWSGTGTQPHPIIRVGNVTGLLGALARANEDLVGAKVTRRRTFLQYIDAVNFASGNLTADPDIHAPDEIWFIDRKSLENRMYVEWQLRSAGDLTGLVLPRRQCIQNVCTWAYRSAECGYVGGAVSDINDVPTTNLIDDNCGHRLTSCRFRYPQPQQLPFGGFPAIGLIK